MHSMINFTDRYRKYSHYYSSKKATGEMFFNNWRDSSMSSKHFLDISLSLLSFKYFHNNYRFVFFYENSSWLLLEVYESLGMWIIISNKQKSLLCGMIKLTYHVTKHFNTSLYKFLFLCWITLKIFYFW